MFKGQLRTVCLECGGTFDSYSMTDRYAHYRSPMHARAIDAQRSSRERDLYGSAEKNINRITKGEEV